MLFSLFDIRKLTLLGVLAISCSGYALAQRMSPADCAAEADRAARDERSVLGGAARGGTKGAVFGAIVGDSRKSAKRGAALGAIVGGARASGRKNDVYQSVYDNCMRGARY
jgi:hypothetical protein